MEMIYAVRKYRSIWINDAWNDLQAQFRRSTLGPLWISVNAIVFTIGVSLVFSNSSSISFGQYVYYVYTGIWVWQFFQGLILQGSMSLVNSAQNLLNLSISPIIYLVQNTFKIVLTWFFGIPVYILLLLLNDQDVNLWPLISLMNLFVVAVIVTLLQVVLSVLTLIYRDIFQIISNLMQLLFFLTPIVWIATPTNRIHVILTEFNPLYWMITFVREPLRLQSPSSITYLQMLLLFLVSLTCAYLGSSKLNTAGKYV
jgi:lipopolysaccharide transport system permease protein